MNSLAAPLIALSIIFVVGSIAFLISEIVRALRKKG